MKTQSKWNEARKLSANQSTTWKRESKIQGAKASTLIVPCEFAANMVGLSLFQHTALMKWEVSSSLSSELGDPNLCHDAGLDMACPGGKTN